ncbi:MAG TPA: ion channel [Kaistia sp.]|nr:ion channel [Kaistia sp.]
MLITATVVTALVLTVVLVHFAVLAFISEGLMPRLGRWGRWRLVAMFGVLIPAHLLEILIFAGAFWTTERFSDLGSLHGALAAGFRSYLYFSASAYTSLGFGDIVPTGELRLIASMETLCGLILIGWSASFTYLEMGRYWEACPHGRVGSER